MIGIPKVKPYKRKLRRHNDAILCLHSPGGISGGKLISGSADHTFRVWDLQKKKIKRKHQLMRPGEEALEKIKISQELEYENSEERDEFEEEPGDLESKLFSSPIKAEGVSAFCFLGKIIYAGYEDGLVCCYSLRSGEFQSAFVGHKDRVNALLATPDGILFSASDDGTIRQWKGKDCECIYKFSHPVSCLAMAAGEDTLYAGLWDKTVRQIDLNEREVVNSWQALNEAVKFLYLVGERLFVTGAEPRVRAFDLKTLKPQDYLGHTGWVYALTVFENMLFTGGDDKSIRIWDLESAQLLDELQYGHENGVTALEFANGELFSGSFDHSIICWDIDEIKQQIVERNLMLAEEKMSLDIDEKIKHMKRPAKSSKGGAKGQAKPAAKAPAKPAKGSGKKSGSKKGSKK